MSEIQTQEQFISYQEYHRQSLEACDIDTAVTCLRYIAERFELTIEQRYWIAFIYGCCYSAVTTFYIYNEFPEFSLVDRDRLALWWRGNKSKLIFQTDRLRIKSNNQFVECFESYRALVKNSQQAYFASKSCAEIYEKISRIKYFGRFSLFNYLDTLNQIADINLKPTQLNMLEAESCRNGVAFAIGRGDLVDKKLTAAEAVLLHNAFLRLLRENKGDIFKVETSLCAYKKYRLGKRYVGYYIDRMYRELKQIEPVVTGVCWDVIWQFREETINKKFLREFH